MEPARGAFRGSDRTFLLVAALLCGVTLSLAALANFGYETLSTMRAYVHGEGRWSKGQKNAVQELLRYIATRDEKHHRAFLEELKVPQGDRRAREELEKPSPDLAVVREGLSAGANDPDDIPDIIRLFRRFRRVDQLDRAVRVWEAGDSGIAELLAAGERLHVAIAASQPVSALDVEVLSQVNDRLTENENAFSQALGEASRWVRHVLGIVTALATMILIIVGLLVSRAFLHRVQRSEGLIHEHERRVYALIQNIDDGVSVLDRERNVTFRSAGGDRILGQSSGFSIAVHPDDKEVLDGGWAAALAQPGKPIAVTFRIRNGTWRILETRFVNLLGDPAIGGVVCTFRDVTDRKKLEARLLASDRMVSIGSLASGIAHEINNPLSYATANLDFLLEELQPAAGSQVNEALRDAREGLLRVSGIVRGLRAFSRTDDERSVPLDISAVLDSSFGLAGNELQRRARVIKEYAPDLPQVLGNEAKLGQVFVNLLVNAAEAIQPGDASGNEIRVRATAADGQVTVEVKDTGRGIAPEHGAQIFDPFYTTKDIGKGMGLGLFVCQNIVASQGGSITFESELGKGTTFRVSLPAVAQEPAASA
jgi:PAS domain S-box-containing protein